MLCRRLRDKLVAVLTAVLDDGATAVLASERDDLFARLPRNISWFRRSPTGPIRSRREIGLDLGFRLHAVLPFGRDDYRASLVDERRAATLRRVCWQKRTACSNCPGRANAQFDAYVMTGRATVAHCDLLIAVWDGLPPRGRGGTAEVVELAVAARHAGDPCAGRSRRSRSACCGALSIPSS